MNSETLDIIDFASLSKEAVKAKQREERATRLGTLAHGIRYAKNNDFSESNIALARWVFLSEV